MSKVTFLLLVHWYKSILYSGEISVSEQGGKQNAKKSLKDYLTEVTATLKPAERPVETQIIAEEDTSESEASESDESDIVVDKHAFTNGQTIKIASISDPEFPLHFIKSSDYENYQNFEISMIEKGCSQPKATNIKIGNSYIGEFDDGYYRCEVVKARFVMFLLPSLWTFIKT